MGREEEWGKEGRVFQKAVCLGFQLAHPFIYIGNILNSLMRTYLLPTFNSKLISTVALMGPTSGFQTLPSMRFTWACLPGALITTQTAGPHLRTF